MTTKQLTVIIVTDDVPACIFRAPITRVTCPTCSGDGVVRTEAKWTTTLTHDGEGNAQVRTVEDSTFADCKRCGGHGIVQGVVINARM